MTGITYLLMHDFDVIWFSRLVTHLMPYWGIFPHLIKVSRSPLICVIDPSYEIYIILVILFRFTMTLWWIFSWVVSLGSRFLMSVWLLDGVILGSWIFTLSFCRVHVRSSIHPHRVAHESSGQIDYIWCHTRAYFPPSTTEMIVLSQICYSFHHSVEGYRICFMSHCFGDIHRDEFSLEHDIQIVTVTLADYSLEIP